MRISDDTEVLGPNGVMDSDADSPFTQAKYNRWEMKSNLSLDSLEDSLEDYDSDSLSEERRYQSDLQNRIHINEEDFHHTANGESEELPTTQGRHEEDKGNAHQEGTVHRHSRSQAVKSSYSELRYDPDWRRKQSFQDRSSDDEEEISGESPRYSDLFSPEVPRPHQPDNTTVRGQNITTTLQRGVQSKVITNATPQPARHQSGKENAKCVRAPHQNKTTTEKRAEDAARKDFIEKNKATLGVRGQRKSSYLHLYKKSSDESSSDQNNGKPVSSESQPVKEPKGKSPIGAATGEPGGPSKGPKSTNLENLLLVRKDNMEVYSGPLKDESLKINYFPPGGFRNIYLSPQEDPEIYTKNFVHWKPQELTIQNSEMMAAHTWERHSGLSQPEVQSLQEFPIPSPVTHNLARDPFFQQHNIPLKNAPSKDSSRGSNPEDGGQPPRKGHRVEEKNQKMLISYLKQEVKLGGIGPSYAISQEKKAQLKQQKEYAKIIQERNRNKPMKAREMPIVQNDGNKGARLKSLEYAKSIPRPQQSPKVSIEKQADGGIRRAMSYDTLLPHTKLLEDLKARHEQEKLAVATISALHII
ncbi:jhy protein homolog [Pyxicephalus adspersus]